MFIAVAAACIDLRERWEAGRGIDAIFLPSSLQHTRMRAISPLSNRRILLLRSQTISDGNQQAYFESNGVQYFVGIFDSEAEAVHAYDSKIEQLHTLSASREAPEASNLAPNERQANEQGTGTFEGNVADGATNGSDDSLGLRMEKGRLVWERLMCIYQRWLLARATRSRLSDSQIANPDYHKDAMVKSLNEEIVILGIAKAQLEEAVLKIFENELTMDSSPFRHLLLDSTVLSTDSSSDVLPFGTSSINCPLPVPVADSEPPPPPKKPKLDASSDSTI